MVIENAHTSSAGGAYDVDMTGRATYWTAWAGVLGPALFTVGFVGQELARTEEYSPLAEPISALEAGPNGWIQQLNFVVFGLLTMAFAVGLHRGVAAASRAAIVGPALLFVSGIALVLAAIFPLREDAAGVTYDPGGHVLAGLMFFPSSALALVALSRRFVRDPRWRGIARYTLVCGVLALAGFVVMGRFVIPAEAPLHDWAGLGQRVIVLGILFPCRTVLGLRLLKTTRP